MVYESAQFTQYYDPELAARAIAPHPNATIRMVGIYQMSFAMSDFIMKKFPNAKYVDASELVDRIKLIEILAAAWALRRLRGAYRRQARVFLVSDAGVEFGNCFSSRFFAKIRSPATLDF